MKLRTGAFTGACCCLLFTGGNAWAQGQTTNLSLTVAAEANITITNSTTSLSSASTFANYTGTTSFTYNIRTSASTGSGNLQLQVTSDFSPTHGPSIASPPTAGDKLAYTCSVSTPATSCSGTQTSSTTVQTTVATFGADAHGTSATGSVLWNLTNDPTYRAGSYTAVVTFTISAT